jgi:ketosteroid isomerase-like protein
MPVRFAPFASPTLAFALLLCGCAAEAPPPAPADPALLMEADRQFAADVAEGGTDAWVSWIAADGAQIVPNAGEIRGHDAIHDLMADLDDPTYSLKWEPLRADIAASGDLGWTTGSFVSEVTAADGTTRRGQGRYVTIWRKQADGSWKVVMDLGNPTTPPAGG